MEMPDFYMVNAYVPNAQDGLKRLPLRLSWEGELKKPSLFAATEKACRILRRSERGAPGNRHPPSQAKPHERGLYRRGARVHDGTSRVRIHRYLPLSVPRQKGLVYLVVVFCQRARQQRRMAHRLLSSYPMRSRIRSWDSVIYADVMGSDHCPVGLVLDI